MKKTLFALLLVAVLLVGVVSLSSLYAEAESTDCVYYVSASGNDSNSGTSIEQAKATVGAALTQAETDNHGLTLPNGSRIVIYLQGETSMGSQQFANFGKTFKTADGKNAPILITTYDYDGNAENRAVLKQDRPGEKGVSNAGNATLYLCNDITLKDIVLLSITNETTGYCTKTLYAGGFSLTLDNTTLKMDGECTVAGFERWSVYADHFIPGPLNLQSVTEPVYSTVTFRNGDYTDLNYVAAVGAGNLWVSDTVKYTDVPNLHCRIVVDEGAVMGKVYGLYGTLHVGSATVEVKGGTVDGYYGTASGTVDQTITPAQVTRKAYSVGSLNFEISGGTVNKCFVSTGRAAALTVPDGLNTTVTGGELHSDGIAESDGGDSVTLCLGAGSYSMVTGDIKNTVSGGKIRSVATSATDNVCGIYFGGGKSVTIKGQLINNISGGEVSTERGSGMTTGGYAAIHFGCNAGTIEGTLYNTISGGTFTAQANSYYFGGKAVANYFKGGIENVFGSAGSTEGPIFKNSARAIILGGGWARMGSTSTTMPAEGTYDKAASISNTIYGGTFEGIVYGGVAGASQNVSGTSPSGTYASYILGDVTNKIYGGEFKNTLYCGSNGTRIYGSVTTDIYGGTFNQIFGGSLSGEIAKNVTLNINPAKYEDVTVKNKIKCGSSTGTVQGNVAATISAGSFPSGLTLTDKDLVDVISSESVVINSAGNPVALAAGVKTNTGATVVRPRAASIFHCLCGNIKADDPDGTNKTGNVEECLHYTDKDGNPVGCDGTVYEWKAWEGVSRLPTHGAASEIGY